MIQRVNTVTGVSLSLLQETYPYGIRILSSPLYIYTHTLLVNRDMLHRVHTGNEDIR